MRVLTWWVQDKENSQYLHSIMEYGGSETLHARKTVSVAELRAFSFQVIFALFKAQKKYQFVHGDLHLKNMMLKPTATKLVRPRIPFPVMVIYFLGYRCTRMVVWCGRWTGRW